MLVADQDPLQPRSWGRGERDPGNEVGPIITRLRHAAQTWHAIITNVTLFFITKRHAIKILTSVAPTHLLDGIVVFPGQKYRKTMSANALTIVC